MNATALSGGAVAGLTTAGLLVGVGLVWWLKARVLHGRRPYDGGVANYSPTVAQPTQVELLSTPLHEDL
jgi:hypothetical protein